jgi:hypothetical protein
VVFKTGSHAPPARPTAPNGVTASADDQSAVVAWAGGAERRHGAASLWEAATVVFKS